MSSDEKIEIDCEYTDELVCPYCGHNEEDDGEMNEAGEAQCSKCKKNFLYEVDYSKSFSSRQVACLNGGDHDWKKSAYPGYPDYQRCKACDKRNPGERKSLGDK